MKLTNPEQYEEYTQRVLAAVHMALHDEFRYLRNKAKSENPIPIITTQREQYHHVQRHLNFYTSHIHGPTYAPRDIFVRFFFHYDKPFLKSLEQQEKQFQKKPSWLRQKLNKDYQGWLYKEEEIFSRVLALAHTKEVNVERFAKRYTREEWYDRLEQGTLAAALGSEFLLLGPLELLSVPIWGLYAGERVFEKLNSDFKKFRKHRITQKSRPFTA